MALSMISHYIFNDHLNYDADNKVSFIWVMKNKLCDYSLVCLTFMNWKAQDISPLSSVKSSTVQGFLSILVSILLGIHVEIRQWFIGQIYITILRDSNVLPQNDCHFSFLLHKCYNFYNPHQHYPINIILLYTFIFAQHWWSSVIF
jgi:hypothetical protein